MSQRPLINQLRRIAYEEFQRLGRVRADTATKLMREGIIVSEMEEQWANRGAWTL